MSATLLNQALEAVTGEGFRREAARRLQQLEHQAAGEEKAQIGQLWEVLESQASDEDRLWMRGLTNPAAALDSLELRLERLDAKGKPCGNGFISPDFDCHKGKGTAGMLPKMAAIVKRAQARRATAADNAPPDRYPLPGLEWVRSSEALRVIMQIPERLKVRIAMDEAAEDGDWDRHAALQTEWQDLITGGAAGRADAEPDHLVESPKMVTPENDEPIDWGNVASEVKLMLELNGSSAAAAQPAEDQEP